MKLVKTFSTILGSVLLASCATVEIPNITSNVPTVEIIFNCGEGVIRTTGLHAKSAKFLPGIKWTRARTASPDPNDIINGEATFKEWTIDIEGTETPVPEGYPFTDTTKPYVINADYNYPLKVNLIIDPNGGHWDDTTTDPKTLTVPLGARWGNYYDSYIPTPALATDVFTGYTFAIGGEAVTNDTTFDDNSAPVTIEANYTTSTDTQNFETDPWPIFINAIEQGFDHIRNTEEGSGGYKNAYIDNGNTFVELEREIELYGETYKVRVIDEDVDRLDVAGTKHAALTFQFEEVVEIGVGWNDTDYNVYQSAKIRTYLNGQFLNALPNDIYPHIKTVYKRTYFGGAAPSGSVSDYDEKIFLPSFAEIDIQELEYSGIPAFAVEEEGFYNSNTSKYNAPYKYYDKAPDEDRIFNYHNDHTPTDYWLRSSDIDAASHAWYINNSGTFSEDGPYSANTGLGICPCFAMGGAL